MACKLKRRLATVAPRVQVVVPHHPSLPAELAPPGSDNVEQLMQSCSALVAFARCGAVGMLCLRVDPFACTFTFTHSEDYGAALSGTDEDAKVWREVMDHAIPLVFVECFATSDVTVSLPPNPRAGGFRSSSVNDVSAKVNLPPAPPAVTQIGGRWSHGRVA
jgi:hypothetical protein